MATSTTHTSPTSSTPLTTTFTPSLSCLSDHYYMTTPPAYYYISLGPPATSACLPPGWDSTSQYFSPGVCPSGYTNACSTTINVGTVTETRATCCPSGYHCQTNSYNVWMATDPCTVDAVTQTEEINITQINGSITTIYPSSLLGLNAYGVSIRYQESDFATTSMSSATGPRTITSSNTVPTSKSTSNHLSSRAKAGIGIGVAIFLLSLLSLLAFFVFHYCRLRRLKNVSSDNEPQVLHQLGIQEGKSELPASTCSVLGRKPVGSGFAGGDMAAVQIHELHSEEHTR